MEPALVISTLLHYVTLFVPLQCTDYVYLPYPWIVFISTTLSVLWHMDAEGPRFYKYNYFFAGLWAFYDMLLSGMTQNKETIVVVFFLNLSIFILGNMQHTNRRAYILNHSIWHLLSGAKCITVATLLQCPWTKFDIARGLNICLKQ